MRIGILAMALSLSCSVVGHAAQTVVVPIGSTWKYFIGTQEASSPTNAWRTIAFDDSTWQSGPAPIGYSTADPKTGYEAAIATTIPPLNPGASVYFRKTFVLTSLTGLSSL